MLRGEVAKSGDEGIPAQGADRRSRSARFSVRSSLRGERHTLAVGGELDLASSPKLERAVTAAISAGARRVVLDLRRLEFIDASGLHVVMQARDACHEAGCEFGLVPGPRQVQRVFELTGMLRRLHHSGEAELDRS